jgi:hypothetical protein
VIDQKVVEKERKKDYEITRIDRFQHRTRYFSDSGIIGSKEFVYKNYLKFKDLSHQQLYGIILIKWHKEPVLITFFDLKKPPRCSCNS